MLPNRVIEILLIALSGEPDGNGMLGSWNTQDNH